MKSVLLGVALLLSVNIFAQSEKYVGAMQKQLLAMRDAKTPEAMQNVVNAFERIGNAEKTQWLPFYYASLAEIWYAFMLNDVKQFDALAEKAEGDIQKAEAIEKNNSEIVLVKGMIASLRMIVDPMSRYMTYGQQSAALVEESKKLDPNNPRPYMWQAQGLARTPVQFGGGCATAKPLFEEAIKRFETFAPASAIHPVWGKEQTEKSYNECK